MTTLEEYCAQLGVTPQATKPELRKALLKATQEHSPDHNPGNGSQEVFRQVVEAYKVLMDPDQRKIASLGEWADKLRSHGIPDDFLVIIAEDLARLDPFHGDIYQYSMWDTSRRLVAALGNEIELQIDEVITPYEQMEGAIPILTAQKPGSNLEVTGAWSEFYSRDHVVTLRFKEPVPVALLYPVSRVLQHPTIFVGTERA